MKKGMIFVAFLTFSLTLTLWAGGARQETPQSTAIDRSNFNDLGTFPLVKKTAELTVMTGSSTDPSTSWLSKFYEEKTNVHINWKIVPREQFKERINLALASGDKLDMILVPNYGATNYAATDILRFAEQHLLAPYQDYLATDSVYYRKRLEERPDFKDLLTLPDGKMYVYDGLDETLHSMYYGKMWVNIEFLKNLNLQVPKTIEEFRNMLRAFRDKDANGNGDPNDDIPLTGATDTWIAHIDNYLMSAFIYDDAQDRLFVNNGKITASFTHPEFQEGLRYLRGLYAENLIYPETFTWNRTARNQLNSQKYESVIGAMPNPHHSIGSREDGEPLRWLEYRPIPPLVGPKGLQITRVDYWPIGTSGFQGCAFIPSTCGNIPLVMRWLDWFMTEEGSTYGYFGEKGVTWKDADPGTTGSTDHQARIDTTLKVPANYAYTNNAVFPLPWWWDNAYRTSWVQPKDMLSPDGTGSEKFLYQMTLQNYVPYGAPKSMIIPPLYYDTANVSEMAVLRTNINTYVEEAIAKFIVGQMNIDTQWDQFQKELKNLGIDRYLQIIQETYNKSPFVKK